MTMIDPVRPHAPAPALLAAVLAVVALVTSAGCSPGDAAAGAPEKLRLAYLPSEEDPEGRMEAVTELAERLERFTHLPVEVTRSVSYAPTIEAMRAGKIDVIRSGGSFTYMLAHEKADAEAIVSFGTSEGPGLYQSILVASPGTGLRSLDDLVERAAELDFAFVSPASTSGHLIPRAILEQRNLDPDADFARLIYTMNHTNSAMTILAGKVDAGALSKNTYTRLIETGRMAPEDLVVLWESEPIPTGPVMVRRDLPEAIKEGIREAYLSLNDRTDPLYEQLQQTYRTEDLVFYRADDSEWDGLRRIAHSVDTMTMLPEG